MAKTNTAKKKSAIDAIIHPFQFQSKSTQTESAVKDFQLGGKTVTVYDLRRKESVTRVEGGEVIKVSHRVRTGKTKRERESSPKIKVEAPVATPSKKKK